jgi:sterol desaturase/sphingolipid hydroxylase (fatty acid hydroxylase superfamily)
MTDAAMAEAVERLASALEEAVVQWRLAQAAEERREHAREARWEAVREVVRGAVRTSMVIVVGLGAAALALWAWDAWAVSTRLWAWAVGGRGWKVVSIVMSGIAFLVVRDIWRTRQH